MEDSKLTHTRCLKLIHLSYFSFVVKYNCTIKDVHFFSLFLCCCFVSKAGFTIKWLTECCFLLCRFIKGVPVGSAALSEELKQAIGLEPMPKGISYIISTKVHTGVLLCFYGIYLCAVNSKLKSKSYVFVFSLLWPIMGKLHITLYAI